jgi:hypothetical protein
MLSGGPADNVSASHISSLLDDRPRLPAVVADTNPDTYARCPEADASTWTVIPVMIAVALYVSLARSIII